AELDRLGRSIPLLVDLHPSGPHYMEQFHEAGGVPALLQAVRHEIDGSAPTIDGRKIGEISDDVVDEPGQTIIRTVEKPFKPTGTIAVLYGNI
ncbi:dihydroxy-acid dehydratase domain-containing protein, partial [Rhizobium johnstonii]|uniref:dihydroxy-acid dehydratase domain-containing protein n=1 Tax=Rhizobium johnstonii TaxID=3019933 RepID=UPI003F9A9092